MKTTIDQLAQAIVAINTLMKNPQYRGITASAFILKQLQIEFSFYVEAKKLLENKNAPRNAGVFKRQANGSITQVK